MTDLWRCTVCGQVSTVGRCCGEETREPWRPIRRKDEEKTRRIEAVADRAEQLEAEIEALRAEVAAWRELSDHVRVGACAAIWPDRYTDARTRDVAAALKRAERMAEALSAYQAAVNKIDDLIEYSLPMPSNTKAALYAVLADLTDALVEGSKHEQDQ